MKMKLFIILCLFLTPFLRSQGIVREIGELPMEVHESSGLIFYNGHVITHNDSGNTPQLFEMDTLALQIKRVVTLSGAENVDWEDMDQDDQYIYIGDFGNNVGTRQNLSVYRISKAEYDRSDTVSAEQIFFNYEDQSHFGNNGNSDWDAEAFFVLGDQLIILTKQWQSNGTIAYAIPKIPGTYTAKRLDSYADIGLVTGATYNPLSGELMVIGYSQFLEPFMVKIEGTTAASIFGGRIEKIDLGIGMVQVEGVAYTSPNRYLFSSEFFSRSFPPIISESKLFSLEIAEKNETPEAPEDPEPEESDLHNDQLVLFQRKGSDFLEYKLVTEEYVAGRAIYDSSGRRIWYDPVPDLNEEAMIDLSAFNTAMYYLTFYIEGTVVSKPFYKY